MPIATARARQILVSKPFKTCNFSSSSIVAIHAWTRSLHSLQFWVLTNGTKTHKPKLQSQHIDWLGQENPWLKQTHYTCSWQILVCYQDKHFLKCCPKSSGPSKSSTNPRSWTGFFNRFILKENIDIPIIFNITLWELV